MKRMLTFLLSAVFMLTAAAPSVLAQEANGKITARSSDPVQAIGKTITVGEVVALEEEEGVSDFLFTPTKSGWYRFYSFDLELGDPAADIADTQEDDNVLTSNDDSPYEEGTLNFDIRIYLTKGETYCLCAYDREESYGKIGRAHV